MPVRSIFNVCNQNLHPANKFYTEVQPAPLDLGKTFGIRLPSSLHHVPTVAVYTLATIAAQSLPNVAWAESAVSMADQPKLLELNNTELTETSAVAETTIASQAQAIALPESVVTQEFAPVTWDEGEIPGAESELEPSTALEQETFLSSELAIASNTARDREDVAANQQGRENTQAYASSIAIALPEPGPPNVVVPTVMSAVPRAEPSQQWEGGGNVEAELSLVNHQERPQPLNISSKANMAAPETQITVERQSAILKDGSCDVAIKPTTSPKAQVSFNEPSCSEVERLQDELRALEERSIEGTWRASPALSIVIPTAFGADNNTGFISATYQARTRYSNVHDGALGIGIGLGDAQESVGVELSYAIASFGSNRDFGSGGFNAKVHRRLPGDWAVAAGWNGILNLGDRNDFEHSLYGVVSKIFRTREDITQPFSRVAVTAGIGNGQFRTENAVVDGNQTVNLFGNVAVRVAEPLSVIAEWSGQDLGVGVSIAPFKNIPLVITPALRDITGAGDGMRFVLGTGFAFKF